MVVAWNISVSSYVAFSLTAITAEPLLVGKRNLVWRLILKPTWNSS